MKKTIFSLLSLTLAASLPVQGEEQKEVTVREIAIGNHHFKSVPKQGIEIYSDLVLTLQKDGRVKGKLTLENNRRSTSCKLNGKMKYNKVSFNFQENGDGLSGNGTITEIKDGVYLLSFTNFTGSNGHNAQLFENHKITPTK